MESNKKSTLIAFIGVVIFILIIVASVTVFSRGGETGRVSDIGKTREGTAEELLRTLEQAGIDTKQSCESLKSSQREVCEAFSGAAQESR